MYYFQREKMSFFTNLKMQRPAKNELQIVEKAPEVVWSNALKEEHSPEKKRKNQSGEEDEMARG